MIKLLRFLLEMVFGFRAFNEAALKTPGPVLLLPNHVSWIDWLFLGVCLDRDWRFVVSSVVAQRSFLFRWLLVNRRTFPVDVTSPFAVKRMAEFLQQGGRLVLFPEGRMSLSGSLMKLYDGTGFLVFKTRAKVITAYLRGAQRVLCSRNPGPKQWFPRVSAHFSELLTPPHPGEVSTAQARTLLTNWLRDQMVRQQFTVETEFGPRTLLDAVVERARERPGFVALADMTLQQLTYRRVLAGADLLAKQWKNLLTNPKPEFRNPKETRNPKSEFGDQAGGPGSETQAALEFRDSDFGSPAQRVGVLLPNVNTLPVTLLSLWAAGKVPAILNYSSGTATMIACAQLAGLKYIITSRVFLNRAKLDGAKLTAAGLELIYLEDVRERIGSMARLSALVKQFLSPGLAAPDADSSRAAVILFTSGSEAAPKGVELTHANLLANIRQVLAVIDTIDTDRMFNALPLFHSFGLLAGALLPLVRGLFVLQYPSPLHYRVVPTVVYDQNCTIMFGTPTFLNGYARKANAYDFHSVRLMVAGAEKLQDATFLTYARKFGIRVIEGYGATECSPAICLNSLMENQVGSVGRFLPGIEWKLEPVEGVSETRHEEAGGAPLQSPLTAGRLLVRGPNVMRGYLNADANAKFQSLGGWYDTGDIVRVAEDGFVQILGRLKRFAKVSGEMVSLTAIEDALAGAFPEFGLRCQIAVIAQPCEDKGEKLIAVTNEPRLTPEQIRTAIKAKGLSNLCVPREIKVVKEIPKLGTGKVNHRELERTIQGLDAKS